MKQIDPSGRGKTAPSGKGKTEKAVPGRQNLPGKKMAPKPEKTYGRGSMPLPPKPKPGRQNLPMTPESSRGKKSLPKNSKMEALKSYMYDMKKGKK
jgi:hypothetical protein